MKKFTKDKVYQGLKPIKLVLSKEVKKLASSQKSSLSEVKSNWKSIVGAELANISSPEKLKQSTAQQERILFLRVPKEFLLEIDYSRDYIIEKLNSYFGYNFISKIIINSFKANDLDERKMKTIPSLSNNASEQISLIKNDKLKHAFKNFFNSNDK